MSLARLSSTVAWHGSLSSQVKQTQLGLFSELTLRGVTSAVTTALAVECSGCSSDDTTTPIELVWLPSLSPGRPLLSFTLVDVTPVDVTSVKLSVGGSSPPAFSLTCPSAFTTDGVDVEMSLHDCVCAVGRDPGLLSACADSLLLFPESVSSLHDTGRPGRSADCQCSGHDRSLVVPGPTSRSPRRWGDTDSFSFSRPDESSSHDDEITTDRRRRSPRSIMVLRMSSKQLSMTLAAASLRSPDIVVDNVCWSVDDIVASDLTT